MIQQTIITTALVLTGLLASTGYSLAQTSRPMQMTPATTRTNTQYRSANLSAFDRQFMIQAAQGGMSEVALAQLALSRATNPTTKDYARQMIQQHTQANQQLMQLAAAKGVTLPKQVSAQQQALRSRLGQIPGSRFDEIYMSEAGVNSHAEQRALFQSAARQAQDPDVKAFASQTLPVVQGHLAMAENMVRTARNGAPLMRVGPAAR